MASGSDPFIGVKLGSYEIIEPVGEGGMARIYKGFHAELNRYAAIKVVNWGLQEDPEFTERFRREAQAIATLRHPNIVQIYDFGEHSSGYFMAMEFIEGDDLAVQLRQSSVKNRLLPKNQIIKIIADVAAALDYAHAHHVIHRDVKPSNIMINREGQSILTDFGLVMLPAQASQRTLGNTFGTPHYVAPEQAISSASAVPASDLYSLGVVLYEMATGQLPFDDESPLSVALKHVSDIPTPPTALNPNLPSKVEDVILKALAKNPNERFASAGQMAAALQEAWDTNPTSPALPVTLPRAATTPPAKKSVLPAWLWVGVVAVVGGLVGGLALTLLPLFQPTPTPTAIAVIPPTLTPTPTASSTLAPSPTLTPAPPTDTPTLTPTSTATGTATPSPTPQSTNTPTPLPTDTPTPTSTPIPPPPPPPTPTPEGPGGKILFKTDRAGFVEIYQMNPDGSNQRPVDDFSLYTQLEAQLPFSSDRQNQIVVRGEGQFDLWWANLMTGQELRLTSTAKPEYDPAWSPVDNRIVYVSEETGNGDIYMLNLDGSAVVRLTDNVSNFDKHPTWSPDGAKVAFWSDMSFAHNRQIWMVDLATGNLTSLSDNPFNDWDPVWVP